MACRSPSRANLLRRNALFSQTSLPVRWLADVIQRKRRGRTNPPRRVRLNLVSQSDYLAPTSSALRSAITSVWMEGGTRRYLANSIVKVPWPCVRLRKSVE